MTASNFHTLVKNFTALTPEELNTLQSLADQSPYSQLIHVLMARGTRDQGTTDQQARLHRAAVYSTDRSVVKWALTTPARNRVSEIVVAKPKSDPPVAIPSEKSQTATRKTEKAASTTRVVTLEGDALIADLSKELGRLQILKHNFEDAYESLHADLLKGNTQVKPTRSKVTPIIDTVTPDSSTGEAPLIEEIKASRKKLKVPSPKVAEQGEIIDNFIKVAPSLPKAKPTQPDTDLSEESVNYSDNIISETLVGILLKQGKKAKAIEMLKKLIWKFPQKKAYFAAQIEALKN